MFRTAVYHCKFAQRWSEKTDIPDISLPHHRQDDLHPQGGYFSSASGEKEPEYPGYSECHETQNVPLELHLERNMEQADHLRRLSTFKKL